MSSNSGLFDQEYQTTGDRITSYNAFVRTKLEYCAIVWNPGYLQYINLLEAVQRKFLKTVYYRKHRAYVPHHFCHNNLLNEFGYVSLSDRRIISGIVFIYRLLTGSVCSPNLLSQLNLFVPRLNCRSNPTFYLPFTNTRHHSQSPMISMCRNINIYCFDIDLFNINLTRLKNSLLVKFKV